MIETETKTSEADIQEKRTQEIQEILANIWLPKNWSRRNVLGKLNAHIRANGDLFWYDRLEKTDREYCFWEDLLKKEANNSLAAIQSFELYGINKDDPITAANGKEITLSGEKITFGELSEKIVKIYKEKMRLDEIRASLDSLIIRIESANPVAEKNKVRLMQNAINTWESQRNEEMKLDDIYNRLMRRHLCIETIEKVVEEFEELYDDIDINNITRSSLQQMRRSFVEHVSHKIETMLKEIPDVDYFCHRQTTLTDVVLYLFNQKPRTSSQPGIRKFFLAG